MRSFPKNLFGRYFATKEKEPAMDTTPDPLDEIAIPAKTWREVLTEVLTDDWNLRKQVMHAKDAEFMDVLHNFRAQVPMSMAKQVLKDLPPME